MDKKRLKELLDRDIIKMNDEYKKCKTDSDRIMIERRIINTYREYDRKRKELSKKL